MNQMRTAVVTGAAQGLGAGIARALHAAGHAVLLADINVEAARTVATSLCGMEDSARACEVDVRSKASIAAMVAAARDWRGDLSILVNNAARTVSRPLMEIEEQEWDDVLAINLKSMFLTAQAVFPVMREQGWGRIINMTSLAGQRGGPQVQGLHYASSKAGIIGLSRYLAHEFAPHGIIVNAIAPGPVLTEATALAPPEKLAAVSNSLPVGRLGTVEEVGALVRYLASDQGGFVVGATIDVNGGLSMR